MLALDRFILYSTLSVYRIKTYNVKDVKNEMGALYVMYNKQAAKLRIFVVNAIMEKNDFFSRSKTKLDLFTFCVVVTN